MLLLPLLPAKRQSNNNHSFHLCNTYRSVIEGGNIPTLVRLCKKGLLFTWAPSLRHQAFIYSTSIFLKLTTGDQNTLLGRMSGNKIHPFTCWLEKKTQFDRLTPEWYQSSYSMFATAISLIPVEMMTGATKGQTGFLRIYFNSCYLLLKENRFLQHSWLTCHERESFWNTISERIQGQGKNRKPQPP